jgi:DnaJ-like protein
MTYHELQAAVATFGLSGTATVRDIRKRYRTLVKQFHPDTQSTTTSSQINASYQILLEYGESFRFSFSLDEFLEQNPDERLRRQFADDPLWGNQ